MKHFLPVIFLFFLSITVPKMDLCAQISPLETRVEINKNIKYFKDNNNSIKAPDEINPKDFINIAGNTLNFQLSSSTYWIRFEVQTNCNKNLYLNVGNPNLDQVTLFTYDTVAKSYTQETVEETQPFSHRKYKYQNYIFDLRYQIDKANIYYIKVKSLGQLQLPLSVDCRQTLISKLTQKDFIFGIYMGIMLVMALYNLFLYFSIRDKSYLFYVAYILSIALIQCDAEGVCFRYFWPNHPEINYYSRVFFPFLSGISALAFFKVFLHADRISPKASYIVKIFYVAYCIAFCLIFFNQFQITYMALQFLAFCASVFVLFFASKWAIEGHRSAIYFTIAWSMFFLSLFIFIFTNVNLLPYNAFTMNSLKIGSALEVTLLSFALADKINTYRKEKEESQLEIINVTQQNAKLILEQNIELEKRVEDRTQQLQESNQHLQTALNSLKDTQTQLVDSEKMASLGQLTAGIAHEINNPINFVTSNVKPLQMDIEDLESVIYKYEALKIEEDMKPQIDEIEAYKKEIDIIFIKDEIKSLLSGISEGAKRTAEIVRSLKTFSRLDETDMKLVNINEGIESTLVLIRNIMPKNLTLIKDLAEIPKVECLGGKMNQVFMNLITNAIQAIKGKTKQEEEEFLTVKTHTQGDYVYISIKDTGTGVPEEIKNKIYEPFFSTKDVGEGTGLGLSIVRKIIESHHGTIDLYSEVNKGTEFVIKLPTKQQ